MTYRRSCRFQRYKRYTERRGTVSPLPTTIRRSSRHCRKHIENMNDAMEDITNGLLGINVSGDEIDEDELYFAPHSTVTDKNGFIIHTRNTMQPLRLPVGVTLKTERIYNEKGERYSRFQDFLPSFVSEGYDNNDVKFTGDIEQDKKTAGMFLHPSITLVAEMNADKTKVTGYQLAVMPYFKEMPVGWKASTK